MTRVVAVRHGETDWNRNGRMQGWAPVPLNETGRKQARTVGRWLAESYEVDRVLASDLLRTRETTDLLLDSVGDRSVSFESAWRERGLGIYQGLSYDDVESRFPNYGLSETAYRETEATPEGGESFREVKERVVGRFEELGGGDDETLLLVTHGGPLCMLLGHVKDQELTESLLNHHLENCAVTEFLVNGRETTIVREGVVPTHD
ncbi:histidine phosphatase family protein [Natronomonas sp.]|uniref:histidine phosphatase family protein n=1 Tax=Natronomonas sp. TaxID=2184060 RepID=UPI003976091C